MMASRGMGAISPSKMPKGTRKSRRDDTDFTEFAEGGNVSSSKNEEEQPKLNVSAVGGGGKSGAGIGGGGRLTFSKSLDKDTDIQAYLEGGGFKPKGSSFMSGPSGAGVGIVRRFKKGGDVWDTPNPAKKSKKLTPAKKASAKAAAKAAGRPYPNLIDNMRAARGK